MTVFVYDNTKIDEFTTFQAGDITVGSVENIDYGDINQTAIIERDANYFNVDDWGEIRYSADIVPFGPINVVDGRDEFGRSRAQWIQENANTVGTLSPFANCQYQNLRVGRDQAIRA